MTERKRSTIAVAAWVVIFLVGGAIDAHARRAKEYEAPRMPNFTSECQQLTKIRTRVSYRIDHRATARCVRASEDQWRQDQIDSSYIEYNRSAAELNRELSRNIRRR